MVVVMPPTRPPTGSLMAIMWCVVYATSHEWYMDLVRWGCYTGVIDCTPGDGGGLGYACILQRMPILCIASNETHAAYIKQHVTKCVFNAMMVASSPPWLF